jgi:hypothetical protein
LHHPGIYNTLPEVWEGGDRMGGKGSERDCIVISTFHHSSTRYEVRDRGREREGREGKGRERREGREGDKGDKGGIIGG